MVTPEQEARSVINVLLAQAGWLVTDADAANIHAGRGVAIREFPLRQGHADYLLYVDGRAAGVIEAKKAGTTLKGIETLSSKYATALSGALPAWRRPLPFAYESTGVETQFTNGLDPDPRSRGASGRRIHTDRISLVRFAMHRDNELIPFPERVNANYKAWLAAQETGGRKFTAEQRRWLEMIRDRIAANLGIEADEFEYTPFSQHGGLGKVHQLFGDKLNTIIEELNGTLAVRAIIRRYAPR